MNAQFLRIAEEFGWDLEQQIRWLEAFYEDFGVGVRLDDFLRARGLGRQVRYQRAHLRDAMLDFAPIIGAGGALNRELQRALRAAALVAQAERTAARRSPLAQSSRAPRNGRLRRWLRRSWGHRPV